MQVPQKQAVHIGFSNLSCRIGGKKILPILKGINGEFRSGNLIAILGPSGAGKTTLLNILAGFINNNYVRGEISINGEPRNMRKFKKLSCYIMQQDALQHQLSVMEIMMLAADLKLGGRFAPKEKCKIINTVVATIGLEGCLDTRTEHLSGGQTKRLATALELISNPPVMFLDEPTTGLDNVVANQCIRLLKTLANQGRTIICTIHQPSSSLLQFFDQLYFMANGYCVYNGGVSQMVPFLEDADAPCPTNYNPADYIIELASSDTHVIDILCKTTANGLLARQDTKETKINDRLQKQTTCDYLFAAYRPKDDEDFPNSYVAQTAILQKRMFRQTTRNKWALAIQLIHHVLSGLSIGTCFLGIGNDASQVLADFKFSVCIMVFYCYTYIMSPILLFPFERELIRREYFNRWYSMKAYYTALMLSIIPQIVIFNIVFNAIIYILTDQPMDTWRFVSFNVVCILVSLTSYGFGITIGSLFDSIPGACIGSTAGIYLIVMCMYGMGYGDTISIHMKVLTLMTFPRQGLIGLCTSLLQDRPLMNCDEDFCFIRDPEELLVLMGMGDANLQCTLAILVGFLFVHEAVAYAALKWKVSTNSKRLFTYL